MSMWNGKTDLWGRKTRPSTIKYPESNTNEHNEEEDYMEEQDKIKHLESKIVFLKSMLEDRCKEIAALNKRLEDSTNFMQTVVLELIQMKNYKPAETKPATALEKYIADKNAKSTAVAKLP